MPLCIICKSRYYEWSYMEPPESCDCGQNISKVMAMQMSDRELVAARKRWIERQKEEQ